MKKLSLEGMQSIAQSKGGKCLSKKYKDANTKLLWACNAGHQWWARPSSVKAGHWCLICSGSKKATIEDMQNLAAKHGGKCLSFTYKNRAAKLLWECSEGHKWETAPYNVKAGHWCPVCFGNKKLTLDGIQQLADKHGGKCLSPNYINNRTKLLWECSHGHQWAASPSNIKAGHWCPVCALEKLSGKKILRPTAKYSIEDAKKVAEEREGKCLSITYVNANTNLWWECEKSHKWEAPLSRIVNGAWCPICAGNSKRTIEEMHVLAKERRGKCLSERYVNGKTKLLWECKQGHRWRAKPTHIKTSNSWCPKCAGVEKLNIEEMQTIARERGGKCLSEKYQKLNQKLLWECTQGHQWEAVPSSIKHQGGWCPECSSGIGERICREFFDQIFNHKFLKVYPSWLVNRKGNRMELDGYCKPLSIAFEHQGEQHFSTKTHFITKEEDLIQRQEDDQIKTKLCKEKGIVLIEVPEIPGSLPVRV